MSKPHLIDYYTRYKTLNIDLMFRTAGQILFCRKRHQARLRSNTAISLLNRVNVQYLNILVIFYIFFILLSVDIWL
jgi:hypothetical protein